MSAKAFRSAERYEGEIPLLVPGHALVRELALAELAIEAAGAARVLVVGAGPGAELVSLAALLPRVHFEVLEPSPPMFDACAARVKDAGIEDRVTMYERCLGDVDLPACDAALSLFVSHLLPDEERRRYWSAFAEVLRVGAPAVTAEIVSMEPRELERWLQSSATKMRNAGVPSEQLLERLRKNLSGGFPLRSATFTAALAHGAGFRDGDVLLRALGVRLERWRYCGKG